MSGLLLRIAVAATLFIAILHDTSAQCADRAGLSADQKLETLERPLNRNDRAAVACAVVYMDELSRRGDARVIPVLMKNLDLQITFAEQSSLLSRGMHLYGGEFPAMDDISWFTKAALGPLLGAIAHAESGSVLSRNAVRTFMALEAINPPVGVLALTQRAARERGRTAQKFVDAAHYAASLPQCRDTLQACLDATQARQ